jgi:hypothetical protein
MRSTVLFALALAAISLTACATSEYEKDPLYDAGFQDGCATGTARNPGTPAGNPVRDQDLWDSSDAYRAGWRSGYGSCAPSTPNRDY